jgi:predicted CXXCH cytochrome family protein
MKLLRLLCIVVIVLALPAVTLAAGKHEGLNCTGCHGIHTAKGEIIFAVAPNSKAINPVTGQPYTGITALCLGCHESTDRGGLGILAVSATHSHPYGIVADEKVALVPGVFLRAEGRLECVGCHDPHPSNLNYKYLRVDTSKGAKMQNFCAMCHPAKADPSVLKDLKIFNGMDERKFKTKTQ